MQNQERIKLYSRQCVHPGNRAEVFMWQNFSTLTEIPVGKTDISGTEPTGPLIEHFEKFTKDLEVRRDLGNWAHVKRP